MSDNRVDCPEHGEFVLPSDYPATCPLCEAGDVFDDGDDARCDAIRDKEDAIRQERINQIVDQCKRVIAQADLDDEDEFSVALALLVVCEEKNVKT